MNLSDKTTWEEIQKKNIQFFEQYYKAHYKEFFFAAYKYVKADEPAQEIVNDVFVKLWQDAERITIESSLKSYIYRAVINRSINVFNKQKKELLNRQEMLRNPEPYEEQREMETNELKIKLFNAIEALPDQCRKVFLMSRSEGLKQQEIADQLGISIKTVKNHITHALKQLNKIRNTSLIGVAFFIMENFFLFLIGLSLIYNVFLL